MAMSSTWPEPRLITEIRSVAPGHAALPRCSRSLPWLVIWQENGQGVDDDSAQDGKP